MTNLDRHSLLPFFHIYGMVVILPYALHKGATVVTMPRFDLEQFLQDKIIHLPGVERIKTDIVLSEVKTSTPLPLE